MPAAIRRFIGANTGEYVVQNGGFKGDTGFTSKAVLALRTRKGSCQVLPEFGSRLHEIKHVDERGRKLAEAYGYEAVAHLADDVGDLKVTATLDKTIPGCIAIQVTGKRGTRELRADYTARIT